MIEAATMVVRPAAGPDTANEDPLSSDTTNPPIIPDKRPAYKGAPEARAIPRQRGKAIRKTDRPAGRSCFSQISR